MSTEGGAPVGGAHRHELSVRFRDLDAFGHVNNVVYGDYAAEAQATMVRDGVLEPSRPVRSIELTFRRSLLLGTDPLEVVSRLAGDVLTQDITARVDDDPVVFATAVTTFGTPGALDAHLAWGQVIATRVRWDDLGPGGTVRPTRLVHVLQEARGAYSRSQGSLLAPGSFVLGGLTVDAGAPLPWRPEPYEARVWVGRIGTKSVTTELVVTSGDAVHLHGRSAMVAIDPDTKRSRALTDAEVERLEGIRAQSSPPA